MPSGPREAPYPRDDFQGRKVEMRRVVHVCGVLLVGGRENWRCDCGVEQRRVRVGVRDEVCLGTFI